MCKEKISIIMPIYNGEKYLRQTLENILKSSYKNIEIVAVNDGSSDSSRDLTGLMINSCRLYNWGKGKLGIETRRSV